MFIFVGLLCQLVVAFESCTRSVCNYFHWNPNFYHNLRFNNDWLLSHCIVLKVPLPIWLEGSLILVLFLDLSLMSICVFLLCIYHSSGWFYLCLNKTVSTYTSFPIDCLSPLTWHNSFFMQFTGEVTQSIQCAISSWLHDH